ncbi:hypothetical protein NDU88_004210, partial [Pleurodeles waltl]
IHQGCRWALWTSWRSSGGSRFQWEQLKKVIEAGAWPLRGTTWKSTAQVDF